MGRARRGAYRTQPLRSRRRYLEGLRFCKNRDGRHNRVHLVISEDEFIDLFRDAVEKGVFRAKTLDRLRSILTKQRDPFLDVIGIMEGDNIADSIDEDLYGEKPL